MTGGSFTVINIYKPDYASTINGIFIEGNVKGLNVSGGSITDTEIHLVRAYGIGNLVPEYINFKGVTLARAQRNDPANTSSVYLKGAKNCDLTGNTFIGDSKNTSGIYEGISDATNYPNSYSTGDAIVNNIFRGITCLSQNMQVVTVQSHLIFKCLKLFNKI